MPNTPSFRPVAPSRGGTGIRAASPSLCRADALASPPLRVKSLGADGRFEGYASVFGAMDLGHDVVMPGAFRNSLAERGPGGIRLLWQHDPTRILGYWDRIAEDAHGLYVQGQIDAALPGAREALALMERGQLDGLSIGYRTEAERRDPVTGLRRLDRVDLWEISLVTFPLLPQARLLPRETS